MKFHLLSAACAALLVTGCGVSTAAIGDTDESDNNDFEVRIKPDAGENLARIKVVLPTGSCLPGNSCTRPLTQQPTVSFDGGVLPIGAELRVKKGTHAFSVNGGKYDVALAAGQVKTVKLAVAHRKCTAAALPNVATTDFGLVPSISNVACPTSLQPKNGGNLASNAAGAWYYSYNGSSGCSQQFMAGWTAASYGGSCPGWTGYTITGIMVNGSCQTMNVNAADLCRQFLAGTARFGTTTLTDGDLAYAPGDYTYTLEGNATPFPVTLKEGDLEEIQISLPANGQLPALFTTRLVFDDPRELPDAQVTTITSSLREKAYSVPANASGTVSLQAYSNPNATYTLTAAGRTLELNQTQNNTIHLKRLDIDDVTVTREDGTSYLQRGTYEVFFQGTRVAGPFKTNTGVDMLSGSYEVVVSYTTAEGAQTERYILSL